MYEDELKAIKRAGRLRERQLFDEGLEDLASNDYLGLGSNKKQFKKAVNLVLKYKTLSPKASMLVNGYHPIHQKFEKRLAKLNGFEEGLVVGSGFLANIGLMESLVRKNDMLFMDEEYHASGVLGSALIKERVIFFKHNDVEDLKNKLESYPAKRQIIAVEGVYSMGGDLCAKEIFTLGHEKNALMIVDEAHSSGVIGENLLGIFEYHHIPVTSNHIKMGTLGKAYGSYGAYILASSTLISFLLNRGKPMIYSTAPSVFDTALALVNLNYIQKKSQKLKEKIEKRQQLVKEILKIETMSLIVPLEKRVNKEVLIMQSILLKEGCLVGAIRQPTVKIPIIRLILTLGVKLEKLKTILYIISQKSL